MLVYARILLIMVAMTGVPAAQATCVVSGAAHAPPVADRCNAPEPPDARVTAQQLDEIMRWIAERFDLPRSAERPAIVFESPADLTRTRNGGFLAHPSTRNAPNAEHRSVRGGVLALYNDARRVIHLSEDWTGANDADMSVLVHEMVHHLQNIAGVKYFCAGEREQIAYQAQSAWLRQFDKSLDSEFGLDALTLLVRSRCM
jgi:hypothetical protein